MPFLLLAILFFFGVALNLFSNYNLPLNRPYTLRNSEPFLLEREYHRMISGEGPRTYIFPRPCISPLDSSNVCRDTAWLNFGTDDHDSFLNVYPLAGIEYRYMHENVEVFDGGLNVAGYKGRLSFYLDARMFVEFHDDYHLSAYAYDREFIEKQLEEEKSGSIFYSSFSRYRASMNYDFIWGRLTAAHDAVHWGPGLFTNLNFHQDAVPFNYLVFTTDFGPFSLASLYGQPLFDDSRNRDTNDFRALYAHRYEYSPVPNLLLGITEQLIIYNDTEPFLFLIPVSPLYMQKGLNRERDNNGNLAMDVNYRIPGMGHIYSEFLIDDIQSPTSLFNDHWANKWAWMAGTHFIMDLPFFSSGLIAEYSRLEPWVYTHYDSSTAQAASGGYPLGNQLGPNSQTLVGKMYIRDGSKWYTSCRLELIWKGRDPGSEINDEVTSPARRDPKIFINGISSPAVIFSPHVAYQWKWINLSASLRAEEDGTTSYFRIQYQY
ncbi:hypothetical protein ACFL5V_07945 [Fibrobacterota bacterium]